MPKTPKKYSENISAALQKGTLAKIDELRGLRTRGEYVRDLVERAVSRLPENRLQTSAQVGAGPAQHEYEEEVLHDGVSVRCYVCAGQPDEPQHP